MQWVKSNPRLCSIVKARAQIEISDAAATMLWYGYGQRFQDMELRSAIIFMAYENGLDFTLFGANKVKPEETE